MKRMIPFVLALLLLSGCGGGGKDEAVYDVEKTPATLFSADVFSEELERLDTDIVCLIYGMDEAELADCAVYTSTGATAEEVAVFVFKTEAQAEAAYPLLAAHRDAQKQAYSGYAPLEVPKLDGAIFARRGATLLYIAAADNKAAQTALDNAD